MIKDISNRKFGKLQTTEKYYRENKRTYWECICDCGNTKNILSCNLIRGLSKSCGCSVNRKLERHNMFGTAIYRSWRSMKARCNAKPNEKQYANYGAKGITYCQEWKFFEGFYRDMKSDYTEGYTIERKDFNKGYYRENCCWIPKSEQNKNKRNNIFFDTPWGRIPIFEAVIKSGLSRATIIGRRVRGWSDEKVFEVTKPLNKGMQRKNKN